MTPERLNTFRSIALANTGAVVKSSAGLLCGWSISNGNAAARFVKIYDKSTAPSSADTPILTILVPAGQTVHASIPGGITIANGIGARCVTGTADSDTTGAGANEVSATLFYQ